MIEQENLVVLTGKKGGGGEGRLPFLERMATGQNMTIKVINRQSHDCKELRQSLSVARGKTSLNIHFRNSDDGLWSCGRAESEVP